MRPQRQAPHWTETATALAGIVSVLLVATGLYLTNAANRDQETQTRQAQISQLFSDATNQLGSAQTDVRLGAIYSLQRLMLTAVATNPHPTPAQPDDAATVIEVLAAYVRDHPQTANIETSVISVTTDVQAALDVITARPPGITAFVDLANANLAGANLAGADLAGANLGGANLEAAKLLGANLTKANLKDAYLTGAQLSNTKLTGANLTNAKLTLAVVENADMTDASLPMADLRGANLTGTNLTAAILTGANLTGADLTLANLTEAGLGGADLTRANLTKANLTGANLTKANLTGAIR